MFNPELAPYGPKLKALKVGESVQIPWHKFTGVPKVKEKPISDGTMTWLCTATTDGMVVKRIE